MIDSKNRVLFICQGAGARVDAYARGLQIAGFERERVAGFDVAMERLRDPETVFDLVIWDTQDQGRVFDEAFDKGRYRTSVPTLLLLDRLYPWVAARGRRPGSLDYLLKPVAPADLAAVAAENVRFVTARRSLEQVRAQMGQLLARLGETLALLGPTGFGADTAAGGDRPPLSDREDEIARALAKGHRVPQIARLLDISPHTVRNHFKAIFRKMGVHSQVELLARLRDRFEGG